MRQDNTFNHQKHTSYTSWLPKAHKFNNRSQEQTESIDMYVNALRALAETCEFGTLKDQLIRDRIVCGVHDNAVRRKLLQESAVTLSKCVDMRCAAEATSAQFKEMALSQHSSEVDLVTKGGSTKENARKEKGPKSQSVDECKFCVEKKKMPRIRASMFFVRKTQPLRRKM